MTSGAPPVCTDIREQVFRIFPYGRPKKRWKKAKPLKGLERVKGIEPSS